MMEIENIRTATTKLTEAMAMFSRGPLDFYLRELIASYDLLMNQYAPFKKGDRVKLIKEPDFNKAPGWRHCSHFLVTGAQGIIQDAGCGEKGFWFGVVFDEESYIDDNGFERPKGTVVLVKPENKHEFLFSEKFLCRA